VKIQKTSLIQIAKDFLLMGLVSFGPGMFAIIYQRLVVEKEWLSEEEFKDGVTFSELAPGPFTLHVVMYIGYHLRKFPGLLVATLAFSLPSILLVLLIASLHHFFLNQIPGMGAFIIGVWAAILASMISTILRIGKEVFRSPILISLAVASLAGVLFFEMNFILLILMGGALYWAYGQARNVRNWQRGDVS